jgi:hypothetical protein
MENSVTNEEESAEGEKGNGGEGRVELSGSRVSIHKCMSMGGVSGLLGVPFGSILSLSLGLAREMMRELDSKRETPPPPRLLDFFLPAQRTMLKRYEVETISRVLIALPSLQPTLNETE